MTLRKEIREEGRQQLVIACFMETVGLSSQNCKIKPKRKVVKKMKQTTQGRYSQRQWHREKQSTALFSVLTLWQDFSFGAIYLQYLC